MSFRFLITFTIFCAAYLFLVTEALAEDYSKPDVPYKTQDCSPGDLHECGDFRYSFRRTYQTHLKESRVSLKIPYDHLIDLCADQDGCQVRIGQYNRSEMTGESLQEMIWYEPRMFSIINTEPSANPNMHRWWAEQGETKTGRVKDGQYHVIFNVNECVFTDGVRDDENTSDNGENFGIYHSEPNRGFCLISFID
ncbi:MAG: hypothetical protein AAF429_12570 [Pseudomonadota bacterium]